MLFALCTSAFVMIALLAAGTMGASLHAHRHDWQRLRAALRLIDEETTISWRLASTSAWTDGAAAMRGMEPRRAGAPIRPAEPPRLAA